MTTSLSVRNPDPLKTGNKQSLSVEVQTDQVSSLFLNLPLGDGKGALMTQAEFNKANIKVQKADPKRGTLDATPGAKRIASGNVGEFNVTRRRPANQEDFCILIEGFATNTNNAAGPVKLGLKDRDQNELASTTVGVIDAKPQIVSFVSDKYNALSGNKATLSWEIKPPGALRLRRLPDTEIAREPSTRIEVMAGTGDFARYQLDAMVGEAVTDSRVITLHSFGQTQVKSYVGPGDGAEILGVYNRGNRLYAVVRDGDPEKGASIWRAAIGFDRESWEPLTKTDKKTPIRIPVDAASRPGAVFDDKLYFMGGSSYDANYPGSDVGYFHFEANTWVGEDIRDEAWPPAMPARMGHGLLASPDGRRLWVLGGYNGDGGALKDVWVYDQATKWAPHPANVVWEPRCLFGATFHGAELWIAGGFDSPGGYPTYDDIWRLDTQTNNWQKIATPLIKDPDNRVKQYCGCALAALDNQIYAFAAYRHVGQPSENNVIRIGFSNNQWQPNPVPGVSSDWVTSRELSLVDCYRFDATVFGGCIFIRRLARARAKDKNIHYLVAV
jgi:hypothetical protein